MKYQMGVGSRRTEYQLDEGDNLSGARLTEIEEAGMSSLSTSILSDDSPSP
jgi:hypothetical protein